MPDNWLDIARWIMQPAYSGDIVEFLRQEMAPVVEFDKEEGGE